MRVEVSNSSPEDWKNNTRTLTLRGLTEEELQLIADKLDEMGWVKREQPRLG